MKPLVVGLGGTNLNKREALFLYEEQPLGVILFGRNVEDPEQLAGLIHAIRDAQGGDGPSLWVDQEGGRVQRLKPPHWDQLPAAARIAEVWADRPDDAEYAAFMLGRIIAEQARTVGFDVVCAPVLDLRIPGADQVIGDRAFGAAPAQVATLAASMAEGLKQGGVLPVSKHWPGHGRSDVDTHHDLPTVTATRAELDATDFAAFRAAADCAPIAMTGHLIFSAIDPEHTATLSSKVIDSVIRSHCGFDGFLVSDDLDMKALSGTSGELARASLAAGCDAVLQCSGDAATMADVAAALDPVDADTEARWRAVLATRTAADPADISQLLAELTDALEPA